MSSAAHKKQRLDQLLVERGFYESRSRARDAILRGCVTYGGSSVTKPGQLMRADADLKVDDPAGDLVARSGLKLRHGLEATGFSPSGQICLDIGASTGGFTQTLLEAGATHVYAIDVGHGQMVEALAQHPRVTSIEGLNARDLATADVAGVAPQFIVCDVSFISLKIALPPALALAAPGAKGIFLVKPQFEVGRENIGKGGLVADDTIAEETANALARWLDQQAGWRHTHLLPSPIAGGDGNREFLLAGEKTDG